MDLANKIEQPKRQSPQRAFIQQFDELAEDNEQKQEPKKTTKNEKKKKPKKTEDASSVIETEIEDTDDSFWEDLKKGKSKKRRNKVLTTFYLDADLNDVINVLYEREKKGFKSRFINESIRHSLKSKGIM